MKRKKKKIPIEWIGQRIELSKEQLEQLAKYIVKEIDKLDIKRKK